ncbi:CPBP family intramembrane glutamic endopeptidase [Paenibacillus sp.]|uniref:CPBP family intramembrane glutamic endopeptidase n=1 Tax=Paenibacillus sp. TaxID=58172 RepID=UPI002D5D5410|nr:CPBP family intramembrane glutamic endopeptidase [Paenibacillus sp.]HZG86871.1 CPBP family intramembrane glutamic endopeptidase [Paenibacillus sp.]
MQTSLRRPALDSSAVPATSILFSLSMRTLFFLLFGLLFVGLSAWAGAEHPLRAAEKWWPFQAILANVATFFALRFLLRREGARFRDLFAVRRGRRNQDLKQFALLLVVGFLLGGIPLYVSSYLIFGSAVPPDLMFQPVPLWAAAIALVLFPITNGLVETPTYIGYALPRMAQASGKLWIGAWIAGLALAFQHVVLPLVADPAYMMWRFVAFIPLAVALGFIYNRTKRLLPIAAAHAVMDLQLAVTWFAYSA